MVVWRSCSTRVFDYGFEGGGNADVACATIDSECLAQMAGLGIDIRVTIYPADPRSADA